MVLSIKTRQNGDISMAILVSGEQQLHEKWENKRVISQVLKSTSNFKGAFWVKKTRCGHVFGVTCHKRPCAYANLWDHVKVLRNGLANMVDATPIMGLGWGGDVHVLRTCTAHMFLRTETCLMPCILCKSRCLCLSCQTCLMPQKDLMQYVHPWQWRRSCDSDLFTSLGQACKKLHR